MPSLITRPGSGYQATVCLFPLSTTVFGSYIAGSFFLYSLPLIQTFHGLIYENENTADGIHEVLKVLHDFVPYSGEDEERHYASQGNVGDQLSVERAVNCLLQVSNGYTPEERLEGLHFEAGDFHAGIKFMQVGHKGYKGISPSKLHQARFGSTF